MRAAPNLPTSVHVKLFEDVTNHDQLRATKQPPPAQRALAELERQQRLQQAVLRQRTNPAVPRYAQPLGVRPQTAPSGRPTLLRGPPGATGYAAVSRPSQRVGGERAYLPVTKAPNKAPTDSYALSPHKANPRLGEVEKEMLHRQALLRRLMREPRHAAHGVARPQSRPSGYQGEQGGGFGDDFKKGGAPGDYRPSFEGGGRGGGGGGFGRGGGGGFGRGGGGGGFGRGGGQ